MEAGISDRGLGEGSENSHFARILLDWTLRLCSGLAIELDISNNRQFRSYTNKVLYTSNAS